MSIGPIEAVSSPAGSHFANAAADPSPAQPASVSVTNHTTAQPVSGSAPKQENLQAQKVSVNDDLPEDVVELHQDPEDKEQVIIEYLDKAKNVILQVPSQEELAVERGIAQEFQQAAKLRAALSTPSEGVKQNGH